VILIKQYPYSEVKLSAADQQRPLDVLLDDEGIVLDFEVLRLALLLLLHGRGRGLPILCLRVLEG